MKNKYNFSLLIEKNDRISLLQSQSTVIIILTKHDKMVIVGHNCYDILYV